MSYLSSVASSISSFIMKLQRKEREELLSSGTRRNEQGLQIPPWNEKAIYYCTSMTILQPRGNTQSPVFVVVSFSFLLFFFFPPDSTNTTNIVSILTTEPQQNSPKQQVHFSPVLNSVQLWTQKTTAEPQTRSLSAAWHILMNSVNMVHMVEKFILHFI